MSQLSQAGALVNEASRLLADIGRTHGQVRSLMVTGCIGGEGATTMAIALARAAAKHDNVRALLVDADFEDGDLTRLAKAEGKDGLRQVQRNLAAAAGFVVSLDGDLNLLPAGAAGGPGLAELANSGVLEGFLAAMLRDYGLIIWDTHALGRSPATGALMSVVPNVVLVAESDSTRMDHLSGRLNEIASARARPLAVLRNRAGRRLFSAGA